jgi:hypothetical protein
MKFIKIFLCTVLWILGLTLVYGISPIRPVREVFTFTTIDAPRQQVWQVLTNFGAYPQWNPFYTDIDGSCAVGAHLHVRVQLAERSLTYATRIQTVTPQSELTWSEEWMLPGLLDGEHRFALETTDSGQTRFVQHDTYSGALVPLVMGLYQSQAEFGFRRMNNALKKRAEQQDPGAGSGL